ncbi:hypothetical protein ACBJ59_61315 [Nonomuraea sp. MTCD27]|uniref:hypothetical protein n=1 Tax=Nonomuraea sp. MTCD27 TaxID=1676747 RepID=UPI0035C18600
MSVPFDVDEAGAYEVITAYRDMLDALLPEAASVYLGGAPDGAPTPYVVLYPDIGTESPVDRALDESVPMDVRWQATSVGVTFGQALLLAGKVDTLTRRNPPAVPGRRIRPVRQEGSQPVRKDEESTGLFFGTAQYLARCDRTA